MRGDSLEPLGRQLKLLKTSLPIVGVVADVRSGGPNSEIRPEVLVTFASEPSEGLVLVARTSSDPVHIAPLLRTAVREANPDQPLSRIVTMEEAVAESVAGPRFHMLIMAALAGLALLLAAVSIGGIVSYSVAQRTHEIGVRIALGASLGSVQRMIVGQALGLTLIGVGIGLAAAAAFMRLLTGLLFEIKAVDTPTFVAVAALLLAVATAASWLPARWVTQIHPQAALRSE